MNIESYMEGLTEKLKAHFGQRLIYVGLQGSYLRGEANEESDIDVMTVIDGLCRADLDAYRNIVLTAEEPDKACGFICGAAELKNWNPLEICHLLHSTKDYFGRLDTLVPTYTKENIRDFIKVSVNNLYHEICHRYIYGGLESSVRNLPMAYKGVFFIVQNLYYLQTGIFVNKKAELVKLLSGRSREVMERAMAISEKREYDFEESFDLLLMWCGEVALLTQNLSF